MQTEHDARPAPLTPADCDLRDFQFMPLDVVRLRDSDLAALESPEACWCAVLLWCAAWHQVPAASLPNDDRVLAHLTGYQRAPEAWQAVREGAMRGWIECADGRLYHPVVAEKATDAWHSKLRQRYDSERARIKKHNQRNGTNVPVPDFDTWVSLGMPKAVLRDNEQVSPGTNSVCPQDVPRETVSKGQGEGQGQGQGQGDSKKSPHTPDGGKAESEDKPSKPKRSAIGLNAYLQACRQSGAKSIPEGDPVFAYAEQVGIPLEFLRLHWLEFKARYGQPDAKRYKDWPSVHRKSVRGNWFRLWFIAQDGTVGLTTVGEQAKRIHGDAA